MDHVTLLFFSQYLPVYTPSEEEKENPSLFASNVRKLMARYVCSGLFGRCHLWTPCECSFLWLLPAARALEVPLTDLSFEDREIILSEGELRIFDFSSLLEFNHLVCRLGWVEGRLSQPVRLVTLRFWSWSNADTFCWQKVLHMSKCDQPSVTNPATLHNYVMCFIFPLFFIRLRAETSEKQLEELARRARKLQGGRLALKDFAQFLNLPVTDTLTHIHRLFDQVNTCWKSISYCVCLTDVGKQTMQNQFSSLNQWICLQCADGRIDVRHFVIALSTICQPKSMETLRLAFSVRTLTTKSGIIQSKVVVIQLSFGLQIYESEEGGEVQENDLAAILEIMLGVKEVELSGLFLSLDNADTETIAYGEIQPDSAFCLLQLFKHFFHSKVCL